MKRRTIQNFDSTFDYTFVDTESKWYDNEGEEHEREIDVELPFSYDKGCKATWGYSGGSPAEPPTVDIDVSPIEKEIGRELTDEEIEEVEKSLWNTLSEEWSDY